MLLHLFPDIFHMFCHMLLFAKIYDIFKISKKNLKGAKKL